MRVRPKFAYGLGKFYRVIYPWGVFLCEESIAHIPEAWKRFLDPDSGKRFVYWSENRKPSQGGRKATPGGFSMRGIDCAHSQTLKTLLWSWFRGGICVLKWKSKISYTRSRRRKATPWGFFMRGIDFLKPENVSYEILLSVIVLWGGNINISITWKHFFFICLYRWVYIFIYNPAFYTQNLH